jgi:hypothetical protein
MEWIAEILLINTTYHISAASESQARDKAVQHFIDNIKQNIEEIQIKPHFIERGTAMNEITLQFGLTSFVVARRSVDGSVINFERQNFEGEITDRIREITDNAFATMFDQEITPFSIDYMPSKCDGVRRAYKS